MWNCETICIEMSFIMQRLQRDGPAFHCCAAPLHHHLQKKGSYGKRWCEINAAGLGSDCFHKDGHCTLKAAASVFVSWHSRVSYMHTHTHVMTLRIILSCLLHSWGTAAPRLSPHTIGNILHHKCGMNAARKRGKDKLRRERESRKGSGFLFGVKRKRVHSNENEGSIWFAITPPPPKMISRRLKLICFLESAVEESCRGAVTPADLQASVAWPGSPGCAACASAMQSILVRRQTADVASCWLHLTRRPLTSPPRGAGDAEKHVMLSGKSKMHWHWRTQTETSTHGRGRTQNTLPTKSFLRALHRAAALKTNLIDLPQSSPIMQ